MKCHKPVKEIEETPENPVIAAGSLLEFVLGEEEISMPIG